ncbi:MAG: prepilin-type N-terminal cleavage/methylation domain-containing protein [Candidatus Omnitrophica bacterium]|nr:prepilin-type N-terminal cleavage/methylation domain-containing protein [Candidatus Omnitrophota bacterium]
MSLRPGFKNILRLSDNRAFSMVEVMIAAVILSISVIGVMATMSAQKEPALESDERVQAALAAKQFLEGLRGKVDATTYNTGDLSLGLHSDVSLGSYTVNYLVSPDGNARKVEMNISW